MKPSIDRKVLVEHLVKSTFHLQDVAEWIGLEIEKIGEWVKRPSPDKKYDGETLDGFRKVIGAVTAVFETHVELMGLVLRGGSVPLKTAIVDTAQGVEVCLKAAGALKKYVSSMVDFEIRLEAMRDLLAEWRG